MAEKAHNTDKKNPQSQPVSQNIESQEDIFGEFSNPVSTFASPIDPNRPNHAVILQMQRIIGNQAVQRLLKSAQKNKPILKSSIPLMGKSIQRDPEAVSWYNVRVA